MHFGGSVGLQRVLKNLCSCLSEATGGFSPLNKINEFKGLYRLRKNSRFCLSEGAGGFSPLNKPNGIKGL
jgi:hypothetical protein